MSEGPTSSTERAYIRADQPWSDAALAPLYDAFPFDADIPFYLALAEEQGGRVLEVASGSGRVLVPLACAGYEVTGLDASPHMLELARGKLERAGADAKERARLVQADMRSFDLDGEFDLAIVAVKSFSYLVRRADQQLTLGTIVRHLRPGGVLALDLLHPTPGWLDQPPGSVRQDQVQYDEQQGATVSRTETTVSTDLAAQVRVIRSAYEVIGRDGAVTKRLVEWPYRYTYRFEAEHLLERAGVEIAALYGGYRREPFTSESSVMLFVARR